MEFPGFILDTSAFSELPKPDGSTTYDMLIIGGGAAAMSAAIYGARKMLSLALISIDFGGLMNEASEIENYLGFQSIQAKDLASRFEERVKGFNVPVSLGIAVKEVQRLDDLFTVRLEDGKKFSGRTLIFATGERHRELSVPGARDLIGRGVSYCATCDAPFFKEKKVMVVGGGNSAFSTILDLIRVNAEIIVVNFSKGWQADTILLHRAEQYSYIKFLDHHELVRINGGEKVESATIRNRESQQEETINCDGIFIEIGLIPNSGPVKNLVELNETGEVVIDHKCKTRVAGFFSAGDVTCVPHKQIIISAGEGAKASLSAYDYLVQTAQI